MRDYLVALVVPFVVALVATPASAHRAAGETRSSQSSLDAKLAETWVHYDAARQLALRRSAAGETVTRSEWEATLALSTPWSTRDAAALRARQDALVQAAKERNRRDSILDLTTLRQQGPDATRSFCAQLPKGGMLHVHPFGTLSLPALQEVFRRVNPALRPMALHKEFSDPQAAGFLYPAELDFLLRLHARYADVVYYADLDPAEQAQLEGLFFLPDGRHGFGRFDACFGLMRRLLGITNSTEVRDIMFDDFFTRAARDHVAYVEFSTPLELEDRALAALDVAAADIARRYGVTLRFLAAFSRRSPPATLRAMTDKLLHMRLPQSVVGINIVSDETGTPALERGQMLVVPLLQAALAHTTTLRRTMHAGELGDPRNPRDAMIMGAERLGHGVALRDDTVALEYARLHHVPIEVNLTSNVRLGAVRSIAEHPFLYYVRLGLPVSLSTDDEGILVTDINQECEVAIRDTDMSYAELRTMAQTALDTAFAPPEVMDGVRAQWQRDIGAFEAAWGPALGGTALN